MCVDVAVVCVVLLRCGCCVDLCNNEFNQRHIVANFVQKVAVIASLLLCFAAASPSHCPPCCSATGELITIIVGGGFSVLLRRLSTGAIGL